MLSEAVFWIQTKQFHPSDYQRKFIFKELLPLHTKDDFPGIGTGEVAYAPSVVDDALVRELFIGAHDRIRIYSDLRTVFAYRGNPRIRSEISAEDTFADGVAYLQIYRFVAVEFHGLMLQCLDSEPKSCHEGEVDDCVGNGVDKYEILEESVVKQSGEHCRVVIEPVEDI